jgi:opacity protein-like surface antigen
MKKKLCLLIALCIATVTFSKEFRFGAGLVAGSELSIDDDGSQGFGLGLNLKGEYLIDENFSAVGGFTYYFPSVPNSIDLTLWQLCADMHYNFVSNNEIKLYGIGGLNYSYVDAEMKSSSLQIQADDSEVGLNLGAGVTISHFFGELKYDTAMEQFQFTFGLNF